MIREGERRDLYVLVADQDMLETMTSLLSRSESLGIRRISYAVDKHLQRDAGCRSDAARRLRPFLGDYRYALVVFDKHGCGRDDDSREEIQIEVETELSLNGWRDRSRAIVIEPELEAWVWSASNHVPRTLGWDSNYDKLKRWLEDIDCWPPGAPKPSEPKEAMRAALREKKRRVSSALFGRLAGSVTLRGCEDPAFSELVDTLRSWFPAEPDQCHIREYIR